MDDDPQQLREQFIIRAGRWAGAWLAATGVLALAVFVRFLYQGLSGQRRVHTWLEIGGYYLLPAAVAALLLAAVRLEPMARLRLLVSGVALMVSLYGVELALVLTGASQISVFSAIDSQPHLQPVMAALAGSRRKARDAADLEARFGTTIDSRTAGEVIADLRKDGLDAIPIVTPSNHLFVTQPDGRVTSALQIDGREVMPLAGVSGHTTLLCNESGQWVRYESDSHGFNNPEDVWRSPHLDIAALGDSFTHGYCVPGDSNFVDRIRQHAPATLNLGIAGDGPLLMLATLEEYLPRLAPATVLWFYYEGNDLTDLQIERLSPLLRNYLTGEFTQPDLARQRDLDRAILAQVPALMSRDRDNDKSRWWKTLRHGGVAFAKLTAIRERVAPPGESNPQAAALAADFAGPNIAVFRDILQRARSRVAGWNGRLYFVYLPEWSRYTKYRSWGKDRRDEVLALVRGLDIPVIDIDPVFQAHGDPLALFPFRGVGHYTDPGHRLVAEAVLRQLATSGHRASQ
jgi:hypothetical protein